MHAIADAFTELVEETEVMYDEGRHGLNGSAVPISLDRDGFGSLTIGVAISQIGGEQLAFVLDVARRYELDVREEDRWLRLSPQVIEADELTADEPGHIVSAARGRIALLWHPDSPGMRVPVRLTWWRRRPSGFATLGDTLHYYAARELVNAARPIKDSVSEEDYADEWD